MKREALLLVYMALLLLALQPVRESLGISLLIVAAASLTGSYLLVLLLPERVYRWLDDRREFLFFWSSTLILLALLALILYNFFREPRGIKELMLHGRGIGALAKILLVTVTLVTGASLGKASRGDSRYPIATSLFTYLPLVMVCYLLHPPPPHPENFLLEAPLAVLFVAAIEEAWSGGGKTERLYNLQNFLLATVAWILSYIIWTTFIPSSMYSSVLFPGMYLALLLSYIPVMLSITLFWSIKKHV